MWLIRRIRLVRRRIAKRLHDFALWLMTPNKWPLLLMKIAEWIDPDVKPVEITWRRNHRG
jgi:hypothetical protein